VVEGPIWPFSLAFDAVLLLFSPERMTIGRLTLALVVAAAGVPRSAEKISWNICRGIATSAI
jgi:hypothetical protein